MTDPATPRGTPAPPPHPHVQGDVPDVEVKSGRGPSIVWIVPIVAVVIAAWLWVQAEREKGPTITITFATADDIEAGKTLIKFKNVNIGKVESIHFAPDLTHVVLTAAMDRHAEPFLRDSTRFWVVRPRIGARGISGLSTLVSGAYIEIEPDTVGPPRLDFTGLENPPVAPNDAPGVKLQLSATTLGSIDVGSGVYFRDIQAGAVESYRLADDGTSLEIDVYIEPPFSTLVYANTLFWNASGIQASLSANGVDVSMQSVDSLIRGGIAFDLPPGEKPASPVKSGAAFVLFEDEASSREKKHEEFTYIAYFSGSVRGLIAGAPVEFRGIQVGAVKDFWLEYDARTQLLRVPVLISMFVGSARRMNLDAQPDVTPEQAFASLIRRGLRAQLSTGSYLTGASFVELNLYPDTPLTLHGSGEYPEIPTVPSTSETLEHSLSKLGDIVQNLQNLIEHANAQAPALVDSVKDTSEAAQTALAQATSTLLRMEVLVNDSAQLRDPLLAVLRELTMTLRSVRGLADMLDRHPEALIRGKQPGDP